MIVTLKLEGYMYQKLSTLEFNFHYRLSIATALKKFAAGLYARGKNILQVPASFHAAHPFMASIHFKYAKLTTKLQKKKKKTV